MTGQLDGHVALITGSVRGIGLAIAEAFLAEGASVVLNGRNETAGKAALDHLDAGDKAVFLQGDVTSGADVDRIVEGTVSHFGRIDILVNNAGSVFGFGPVTQTSDEDFFATLDLNLVGAFRTMRKALPYMIEQHRGRIINISSLEGKTGMPMIGAYVAAKHGLQGLTRSVAKEVGRFGVTANCICPGLVPETGFAQSLGGDYAAASGLGSFDEIISLYSDRSSTGKVIQPEECAAPAVLLASDLGASISGVMLNVDGGTSEY